MEFSNSSTQSGLIQDIDFLLFGSSDTFNTDYSLKDRTRNVNISMDEAVAELFKADPNFMWDDTTNENFPIATLNLTAVDHFTIPDSSLVVHRIRIKDQNGAWKTLTPKMRREMSDSELASTGTPNSYYKIDNAIFPIPVPNYTYSGGIELEFQRGANHFVSTDTTKKPGFNPQFHSFLSVGAALRYAIANGMNKKITVLAAEKERIKSSMREHYQLRSPDERPKMKLRAGNIKRYGF